MANTDYWHSSQVVLQIIPIRRNLAFIQADTLAYSFLNGQCNKKYSITVRTLMRINYFLFWLFICFLKQWNYLLYRIINHLSKVTFVDVWFFKIFCSTMSQLLSRGFILFVCVKYIYAEPTSIERIDSIKLAGARDSFHGIKCNNPHQSPSKITNHHWTIAKTRGKFIFHRWWFVSAYIYVVCAINFYNNYIFLLIDIIAYTFHELDNCLIVGQSNKNLINDKFKL